MSANAPTLQHALSRYGAELKRKLANPAATGAPEDQLRVCAGALLTAPRVEGAVGSSRAVATGRHRHDPAQTTLLE